MNNELEKINPYGISFGPKIPLENSPRVVILTFEAEAEEMTSDDVVQKILDTVPVP